VWSFSGIDLSRFLCRSDALPVAQPTASKHWRKTYCVNTYSVNTHFHSLIFYRPGGLYGARQSSSVKASKRNLFDLSTFSPCIAQYIRQLASVILQMYFKHVSQRTGCSFDSSLTGITCTHAKLTARRNFSKSLMTINNNATFFAADKMCSSNKTNIKNSSRVVLTWWHGWWQWDLAASEEDRVVSGFQKTSSANTRGSVKNGIAF